MQRREQLPIGLAPPAKTGAGRVDHHQVLHRRRALFGRCAERCAAGRPVQERDGEERPDPRAGRGETQAAARRSCVFARQFRAPRHAARFEIGEDFSLRPVIEPHPLFYLFL